MHDKRYNLHNSAQTAVCADDEPTVDAAIPPDVLEFANLSVDFVFRKVGSRLLCLSKLP